MCETELKTLKSISYTRKWKYAEPTRSHLTLPLNVPFSDKDLFVSVTVKWPIFIPVPV